MTDSFFDYSNTINYPIFLHECKSPETNSLFRKTIDKYHSYKKYSDSPTRNIRYLIYETESGNLVGAIGLSSCVLAIQCRDEYIGWNKDQRFTNSNHVANNSRFCLIQDNFTLKDKQGHCNIGTMALKLLRTEGAELWKKRYGQELVLLETYVEPNNNRCGTVYKADNWISVGMTKGNSISKTPIKLWKKEPGPRGQLARENPKAAALKYGYINSSGYDVSESSPKMVFIKPLVKYWKKVLFKTEE